MQIRVRTLLIVLAVGPPVLAGAWWDRGFGLGLVGGLALVAPLFVLVVIAEWMIESRRKQRV